MQKIKIMIEKFKNIITPTLLFYKGKVSFVNNDNNSSSVLEITKFDSTEENIQKLLEKLDKHKLDEYNKIFDKNEQSIFLYKNVIESLESGKLKMAISVSDEDKIDDGDIDSSGFISGDINLDVKFLFACWVGSVMYAVYIYYTKTK